MGYAKIISGGPDGRYMIEVDSGEQERKALTERFTVIRTATEQELSGAEAKLAQAEADLAVAFVASVAADTAYIELLRAALDNQSPGGGAPVPTANELQAILDEYARAGGELTKARLKVFEAKVVKGQLQTSLSAVVKALAIWRDLPTKTVRGAWCMTHTENLTANQFVATAEVPGEPALILIAPQGRAPALERDGYLWERALQAPWQSALNFAILPGVQKWKPTYRTGIITALDDEADTANVALDAARSSAQRLSVNQATNLVGIPVVYLDCHAFAFEVGDPVVVEFQGQDWTQPRVVGFVTDPRPCTKFQVRFKIDNGTGTPDLVYEVRKGKSCPGRTAPPRAQPLPFLGWRSFDGIEFNSYNRTHPGIAKVTKSATIRAEYQGAAVARLTLARTSMITRTHVYVETQFLPDGSIRLIFHNIFDSGVWTFTPSFTTEFGSNPIPGFVAKPFTLTSGPTPRGSSWAREMPADFSEANLPTTTFHRPVTAADLPATIEAVFPPVFPGAPPKVVTFQYVSSLNMFDHRYVAVHVSTPAEQ